MSRVSLPLYGSLSNKFNLRIFARAALAACCINQRRKGERENSPPTTKSRHDDRSETFIDSIISTDWRRYLSEQARVLSPRREINAVSSRLSSSPLPTLAAGFFYRVSVSPRTFENFGKRELTTRGRRKNAGRRETWHATNTRKNRVDLPTHPLFASFYRLVLSNENLPSHQAQAPNIGMGKKSWLMISRMNTWRSSAG